MWHDIETTEDLLNFSVIADTAAQLVHDSAEQPLSIGISGSWGTGKSSLVKMIGESLRNSDTGKKYVFLEFNAWLYQGYDDARMALLQAVADILLSESNKSESHVDKAKTFLMRVNWLRLSKILVPQVSSAVIGGLIGGPLGVALSGIVGQLFNVTENQTSGEMTKIKEEDLTHQPEIKNMLNEKINQSPQKEIQEFRDCLQDLLESLDVTLVVLVDDLDRCLPETAISTLEAMRLLLFLPRTAFIIAADQQMIRLAVRARFRHVDLSDEIITSYFDKLIQVPLRVPRLGITEIKGYLILLLAELAERRGKLDKDIRMATQATILDAVRKSWSEELTRRKLEDAFGDHGSKLSVEIDLADQLAHLMVLAPGIHGNPRLIKRFLNSIMILDSVAKAQGMSIAFDHLVKLQLLERYAPRPAFEFLINHVTESKDGKATFIDEAEQSLSKDKSPKMPADSSWDSPFIMEWLKINPRLGDTDLRPLLYLSRQTVFSSASFDELSSEGRDLLNGIMKAKTIMEPLIKQLQSLGENEAERILSRLRRKAREQQWEYQSLLAALHVPKAFPSLGSNYVNLLNEIPPSKRPAPLIPHLCHEIWAKDILKRWGADNQSPKFVKNAIAI
ncbi:MAG: P-loop NTPase fold protein [Bacteroidetes bacterium]|nr:P-loop NTPase fold protein [Bacteroidota bacterium]